MILTHMVLLGFFDGAGGGTPAVATAPKERIRQGIGVGFCLLLGLIVTASKG